MFVLPFLITLIIFLWMCLKISRRDFEQKLSQVDGPKGYFLLGNALDFPTISHLIPVLLKYNKQYDGMVRMTIGIDKGSLSVSKYNVIEKILSSSKIITKSREYLFLSGWLATGLLTSTGEKWQKRRKLLTPAFHFQILEQVVDVFNSATEVLIEKLRKEVGKTSFDVYPYITLCALDVISEASMGIKINAQLNEENNEYVKCVKEMGALILRRTMSLYKWCEPLYWLSSDYRKEARALKILHDTTDSVIKQRRQELKNKDNKANKEDEFGKKKRLAFLDLLLNATIDGVPLTDADIREEVDTFMFEGHDTTSSGISFALYNLAKHPELQDKVFEEQLTIFDKSNLNRPLNYNDLQEMKYLEMFVKESMRLFPPVPMFGRSLPEDTELDGKLLPKDLDTGLFIFGVMRNPDNFPDPEKFDPERFAPENKTNIKPYAYIPFSAGPRNCIGQKFAMMELKATLSKIIRNYKLMLPVEGFEPHLSAELILKSLNGICIRLEPRKI